MPAFQPNSAPNALRPALPVPLWMRLGWLIGRVLRLFQWRHKPTWLILKPGSLGDALLFSGALREFRKRYPNDVLVLATSQRAMPIYDRCPYSDSFIVVDEKRLSDSGFNNRLWRIGLAVRLFSKRYKMVLYPFYGDPSRWSHAIFPRLAARHKVYLAKQYPSETTFPSNCLAVPVEHNMHEIDKMAAILRTVGCHIQSRQDIWPEMPLTEEERAFAREAIAWSSELGARSAEHGARSSEHGARSSEHGAGKLGKRKSNIGRLTSNVQPITKNEKRRTKHPCDVTDNHAQRTLRVAVCAGARFKCKAWPEERYAELLARLASPAFLAPRGYDRAAFFLLGEAGDWESNEKIIGEHGARSSERGAWSMEHGAGSAELGAWSMERGAQVTDNQERRTKNEEHANAPTLANLAGTTSIHQAAAIIETCDLCIGNDTFGLHAAIAVGTPSVVIMWGGSGDTWIPWGNPRKHRMARAGTDCLGCGGHCVKKHYVCMDDIKLWSVMDNINALFSEKFVS